MLTSHDLLQFDDGAVVSVADVLADPERFHGQTLADPMEGVGYGRGKAKVYRNQNGSVIVNSFAHGGIVYRLRHDAAFIEAQLTAAGEGAPFVLAGLMPHVGDMDPVTRERLRNLAAKLGKVSKTTVKKQIEADAGKARRDAIEAAKARREAERGGDAEGATPGPQASDDRCADRGRLGGAARGRHRRAERDATSSPPWAAPSASCARCTTRRSVASGWCSRREQDIKLQYGHRHYIVGYTSREWRSGRASARRG